MQPTASPIPSTAGARLPRLPRLPVLVVATTTLAIATTPEPDRSSSPD